MYIYNNNVHNSKERSEFIDVGFLLPRVSDTTPNFMHLCLSFVYFNHSEPLYALLFSSLVFVCLFFFFLHILYAISSSFFFIIFDCVLFLSEKSFPKHIEPMLLLALIWLDASCTINIFWFKFLFHIIFRATNPISWMA